MNPYDVDWEDVPNPVADAEYRRLVVAEIDERRRLTGRYSLHDVRDGLLYGDGNDPIHDGKNT